jgi:hypothetical protein
MLVPYNFAAKASSWINHKHIYKPNIYKDLKVGDNRKLSNDKGAYQVQRDMIHWHTRDSNRCTAHIDLHLHNAEICR